jgi:pyruvate/2-oxoglutarate dehydrogenase complex dihydrolipoamide acyltransferase (E2) component
MIEVNVSIPNIPRLEIEKVDGATGAQFLQTLRTYLESPLTMLL